MIGLVALDLVLRIVAARVVYVALVVHVAGMHAHHPAANATGLRIPADMIADLEALRHEAAPPLHLRINREMRFRLQRAIMDHGPDWKASGAGPSSLALRYSFAGHASREPVRLRPSGFGATAFAHFATIDWRVACRAVAREASEGWWARQGRKSRTRSITY